MIEPLKMISRIKREGSVMLMTENDGKKICPLLAQFLGCCTASIWRHFMRLQTSLNPPPPPTRLATGLDQMARQIALYLMILVSVLVTLSDRWHQAEQQAFNRENFTHEIFFYNETP